MKSEMTLDEAKSLILRILGRNKALSMNEFYKNNRQTDSLTLFHASFSLKKEGKLSRRTTDSDTWLYLIEQPVADFRESVEAFEQPILEFGRPVEAFDGQRHRFFCKNARNHFKENFFLNLLYFGKFTALRRRENMYEIREKVKMSGKSNRPRRKYRYSFVGYYTSDELKTFIEESKCK